MAVAHEDALDAGGLGQGEERAPPLFAREHDPLGREALGVVRDGREPEPRGVCEVAVGKLLEGEERDEDAARGVGADQGGKRAVLTREVGGEVDLELLEGLAADEPLLFEAPQVVVDGPIGDPRAPLDFADVDARRLPDGPKNPARGGELAVGRLLAAGGRRCADRNAPLSVRAPKEGEVEGHERERDAEGQRKGRVGAAGAFKHDKGGVRGAAGPRGRKGRGGEGHLPEPRAAPGDGAHAAEQEAKSGDYGPHEEFQRDHSNPSKSVAPLLPT